MPETSRAPLRTVVNALALLRAFDVDEEWLGVRELARMLDLNSASVHNLLSTLVSAGFVEQDAKTRKYRLGLGLIKLAGVKLAQLDIVAVASPLMKELMEATGETITLSVLHGDELLYLAKLESPQPVRVASRIGGSAPIHCSANGKALLAFRSEVEIDRLLAKPLRRFTEATVIDRAKIKEDLNRVRSQDYATDFGAYIDGVHAVAAPVRDAQNQVIASIGVIAPAARLQRSKVAQRAAQAIKTARAIALGLGWTGVHRRPIGHD
ncbi:MAG TPA: IclR family transcriptional regulator [Casimicrobiaceae bacterium]|nr:IclR family transcriptional regulator [Casimicrobiaceae bacterium]